MSSAGSPEKINGRWWAAKTREARGRDMFELAKYLRGTAVARQRREDDRHHMRLYANGEPNGEALSPRDRAVEALAARRGNDRIRYNLVRSSIDTAASQIAQQRPRPMFLTTAGMFSQQRQARLMTRAIEGQFYDLGAYKLGPRIFLDGTIVGTGHVFGYLRHGRPVFERCLPGEIIVDHDSAIDGWTTEIYRQYTVSRDELKARFSQYATKIETAEGPDQTMRETFYLTRDTKSDRVAVIEGYRIDRENPENGRHVLAISNATLVDRVYARERLPFSVYRWSERQFGYWGCGLAEQGRDPQWRVNKLIAKQERQNNIGSSFKLLVEQGANIRTEAITNSDGEIIRYNGAPPQYQQGPGVHPSIVQEIADIREQFFSEQGISLMVAEGKKPSGLDSGAAQRIHHDILSQRQIMNARAYEDFYLDLADLVIDLNDQAAEIDPDYSVDCLAQNGRTQSIKPMRWLDIRPIEARKDFRIRMFPTSALPTTPTGKMQTVQEWIAGGFVSRPYAMALLDFPDIDTASRMELADLDFAMWQVEEILDGQNPMPDEGSNLTLCADIARRARLQCAIDGAPEDVLQALYDHSIACLRLDAEAKQAQAMLAQPMPAQPALPGVPANGEMLQ